MKIKRRAALGSAVSLVGVLQGCRNGPRVSRLATPPIGPGLGLQLWSVREDCARDVDETLAQVSACGFKGVEFAGLYKYASDAKALGRKLNALNLTMAGNHLSIRALRPGRFEETVAFHQQAGCRFLVVGGDPRFTDLEGSKRYADEMNTAALRLRREGLYCGHHNHVEEFTRVGDTTFWELFAQRTEQNVFLQLDVGWAVAAGMDPVALIRKYKHRFRTMHVRGTVQFDDGIPVIGSDSFDWQSLLRAAVGGGGTEWLLVEQLKHPAGASALTSARLSLDGLRAELKGVLAGT